MNERRDITGAVSYYEINAMVRLGQRVELDAFLRQFLLDLRELGATDMEMARSRFIALVTSLVTSVLEIGASPSTEARIADASRLALAAETADELATIAGDYLSHMTVCARPNANRQASLLIERCKAIIAREYGKDITDESLAEMVELSRSHFRYLFKEVTGMPFKRYLSEVRLNAARAMVLESRLSIKEICAKVGYQDTSSFYRAYRAFHGVAPTAHRTASV